MRNQKKGKFQTTPNKKKGSYFFAGFFASLILFGAILLTFIKTKQYPAVPIQPDAPSTISQTEAPTQPVTETTEITGETAPTETLPVVTEKIQPIETTVQTEPPTQAIEAIQPLERIGTVLRSAGQLNVRSGAGTNYEKIAQLNGGDTVTVYEQVNVGGTSWGNIGYGWVCMDYITFEPDTSLAPTEPPQYNYTTPTEAFVNKREQYAGYWISTDQRYQMGIRVSGGRMVEISIEYRESASYLPTYTYTMTGRFDDNDNVYYSNGYYLPQGQASEGRWMDKGFSGTLTFNLSQISWVHQADSFESAIFNRVIN